MSSLRSLASPERRQLFSLSWPIAVALLSHTAMSVADTIWVGQLGTSELAGVGLGSTATFLFCTIGFGLTGGARIAVSQAIGAGDHPLSLKLGWQGLWVALLAGLVVAVGLPMGPLLFGAIGAEAEVTRHALAYFGIRILGCPLLFASMAFRAFCQGCGDTRTPMKVQLVASALNIVLDPIAIFGLGPLPAFGIAGAAWVTVFAQTVGMVLLCRHAVPRLWKAPRGPSMHGIGRVVELGLPMTIRGLLDVGAMLVFSAVLARTGAEQLAAHVLVIRIVSVSFLPGYAFADATSVLVGQAVGALRPDDGRRAWRAGLELGGVVMLLGALLFVLAPEVLLAPFGAEPTVVEVARDLLVIAAIFQLFDAVAMVSQGALNGAGDTRFVMASSVACSWMVNLPISLGLGLGAGLGARGAWIGLCCELAVVAAISAGRIRAGALERQVPPAARKPIAAGTRATDDEGSDGRAVAA